MCGILGALPAVEDRRFQTALNLISHRGPDAEGVWISADQAIQLGHRRLSIIDLSGAARQPMHIPGYSISYNGEIYNYPELRDTLTTSRGIPSVITGRYTIIRNYGIHLPHSGTHLQRSLIRKYCYGDFIIGGQPSLKN